MNIPLNQQQCITPEPTKTIISSSSSNNNNSNAIVVDSLLCFLYNFRSLPQINKILINNFSFSSFLRSFELISTFGNNINEENNKEFNKIFIEKQQKQFLFDQIIIKINKLINSGKVPIFAASDLHCLPLRPFFYCEDNINNNINGQQQLFNELRQIRFLLQDYLLLNKNNVESYSFNNNNFNNNSPTHSINSLITKTTTISSPESSFPPIISKSVPITPINECSLLPSLPTTTTISPIGSSSTPAKGLRISQVLQKLTKNNKDIDIIVENKTKKQQIFENNNNCVNNNIGETFNQVNNILQQQQQPHHPSPTILHPALALMKIQMLGQLASLNNQQKIFQKNNNNNELVEQQKLNYLKIFRQENSSAFSIYKNNNNEIKTTIINSLIKPKEELSDKLSINILPNKNVEMIEEDNEGRKGTKRKLIMTEEEEENNKLNELNNNNNLFSSEDLEEEKEEFIDREEEELSSPTFTNSPIAKSDDFDGFSDIDSHGNEFENGEKPFFCSWPNCQKRFANKFLLKKHKFIHTGQKPHICQFCKKPFNRKDNLLRHKKTHLQNGMTPTEGGVKRRHNMLKGISEQKALELQLLPLNSRGGINERKNNICSSTKNGCRGIRINSECSDEISENNLKI